MKKPDIHVIVADSKCCGFLNADWIGDKAGKRPVHWDSEKRKWVRCRIRAYWRLEPVGTVKP